MTYWNYKGSVEQFFNESAAMIEDIDVVIKYGEFNATECEVTPISDKGRELFESTYGAGCLSITIIKSSVDECKKALENRGMSVRVI
jgi:hypothetical protein